jgi:hypothetical protein
MIAIRRLSFSAREVLFSGRLTILSLFVLSCSLAPKISTVSDERLEGLVRDDALRIVELTEDKGEFSRYQFFLSEFPRKDILGLSTGDRRIYIRYELAQRAANHAWYRWLLRQTLAHEIAHEIAGHANHKGVAFDNPFAFGDGVTSRDLGLPWNVRMVNYSAEKELEADLNGMKYWRMLQWDCRIWVRILEDFSRQNYSGDMFHPTDARLRQAARFCLPESDPERIAIEKNFTKTVER